MGTFDGTFSGFKIRRYRRQSRRNSITALAFAIMMCANMRRPAPSLPEVRRTTGILLFSLTKRRIIEIRILRTLPGTSPAGTQKSYVFIGAVRRKD